MTPLSFAAIATTPGTSLASTARRSPASIRVRDCATPPCAAARPTMAPTETVAVSAAVVLRNTRRVCCLQVITLPPIRALCSPYRRRGEASLANCEGMSAKVTLSEVRTSITLGWRAASASCNAGFSPAGSSTRTPRQPSDRAIAAWSQSLNSAAKGPEPCNTQPRALLLKTTVMIGMDELCPECRRDAEAHRPGASGLQKAFRRLRLVEMRHHDAVLASVAGDDRVLRQPALQLADHALRQDRHVVGEIGAVVEITVPLAVGSHPPLSVMPDT